jgi:hypothetical protein
VQVEIDIGDVYGLALPEFPELRFELRYLGGRVVFRYGMKCAERFRGYSRKYRKRMDYVRRGFFVLMMFSLGEIYSEKELDRLFGDDDDAGV